MPSPLAWTQAFPRRLTVAPRERQTVRLLARPPAGLADGEYWLRMVIAAQAGRVPISGVTDTTAIQVGLTLEVRTIIGVNYRKGPVTTGLALSQLRALPAGTSEWMTHPGWCDAGLSDSRYGRQREIELAGLGSPVVRGAALALGITLCDFRAL